MTPAGRRAPPRLGPQGAVAVPFAVMLPVMLGFVGLAIDRSMVCARSFELQHLAGATAATAAPGRPAIP
jgi:Flp pilus assembly protein TadG